MELHTIFKKKSRFAIRNVGNELILVPLKNNVAEMNEIYTMNEVGNFIWEKIDGKNNIEDIIFSVIKEFDVDEKTARKDFEKFLLKVSEMIAGS